ncbi:beta-N-acetylhexosaminidase family protein [Thermoanaerobacterium thermosaccharolyticum]|uniref:beta-N-acetylhexosaminidase family protein n=1 Tax=Thermoanaerobacterium thermosaccharolyticum TaxID=1517 RepID=UPI002FD9C0CA
MIDIIPEPKEIFFTGCKKIYKKSVNIRAEEKIDNFDLPEYIKIVGADGDLKLKTYKNEKIPSEGYRIKIKDDILVEFSDYRGYQYAIDTVFNLFKKKGDNVIVPEVEIIDWPSFKMRGIIEGFYGEPWSFEDRIDMISFLRRHKMNTYFYAPKDDPYHREKWREPYPPDLLNKLDVLINKCNEKNVDFVFSVSPGNSIKYTDDHDFKLLCEKYDIFANKGVRKFALLLDDIDYELKYEDDIEEFLIPGNAHAFLCNKVFSYLKDKYNDIEFIMCPTEYHQEEDSDYRRSLREKLDKNILVFWTGIGVTAPTITNSDADNISNIYKHELVLWDNYPVNDYSKDNLYLGAVINRSRGLYKHNCRCILSNPMNQAEASKISLITYSYYMWNPEAYNPYIALEKAYKEIGGEGWEYVKFLCENAENPPMWSLETCVSRLIKEYQLTKGNIILEELGEIFESIYELPDNLEKFVDNKRFLQDIRPWYNRIKIDGKIGRIAINVLKCKENIDVLEELLDESRKIENKYLDKIVYDFYVNIIDELGRRKYE